ncbi:hypothetical protein EF808_00285 [archaeon]|nr:MAG: hypothetical protein EF808_00285 [archaeon]
MQKQHYIGVGLVCIVLIGVVGFWMTSGDENKTLQFSFDFSEDDAGWEHLFVDYPVGEEEDYELEGGRMLLPDTLGHEYGYYLSGENHSDDLSMLIKRSFGPEDGLDPNTTYRVKFFIEIASNAPSGCVGVGGAPGESVYFKAGAAVAEPTAIVEGAGGNEYYRLSIDKGNQASGGNDSVVLGHIGTSNNDCHNWEFLFKTFQSTEGDSDATSDQNMSPDEADDMTKETLDGSVNGSDDSNLPPQNPSTIMEVTTDDSGQLWIFMGTDSGFEATSSIYINEIQITFEPVE